MVCYHWKRLYSKPIGFDFVSYKVGFYLDLVSLSLKNRLKMSIGIICIPMLIVGTKKYINIINNIFRRKLGNSTNSMLNLFRYKYFEGEDIHNVFDHWTGELFEKSF